MIFITHTLLFFCCRQYITEDFCFLRRMHDGKTMEKNIPERPCFCFFYFLEESVWQRKIFRIKTDGHLSIQL